MENRSLSTTLSRALRLRCPRCGGGKLFIGWFKMFEQCPNCKLRYERAPGYFLGSAYINYGLTSLVLTVTYVTSRFVFGVSNAVVTPPLVVFFVAFPLFFFRYARSLWLGMDYYFDVVGFDDSQTPTP